MPARDQGQAAGRANQEWIDQFPGELFQKEELARVLKVHPEWKLVGGLVFSTYGPITVANTVVESTLLDANVLGSKTFPRNFWIPGRICRLKTRGTITAGTSQSSTLRVKLAGQTMIVNTGTLPNGLSGDYVELELDIVCMAAGKIRMIGRTMLHAGTGVITASFRELLMAADATIDPTLKTVFDHTYQWATASTGNSITIISATMECLR